MKEYEAVMASDFVTVIYAFMTEHKTAIITTTTIIIIITNEIALAPVASENICIKVIK